MLIHLIFALILPSIVHCTITCDDVLNLPSKTKISLQDLKEMNPKDIIECLKHLGREALKTTEADYIWRTIIKFYGGVSSVPDNVLSQLHWVTTAVTPEDYANITIGTIEIVKNFGFDYGLDSKLLEVIADRVREDFSNKEPEDYTYYDLKALNKILCAFNRSEIERIHASAYKESAVFIGRLDACNPEVMRGFATLAEDKYAFGPSNNWTGLILKTVGNVAEYLPGGITKELENRKNDQEKVDEPEDFVSEFRSTV